MKYPRMGLTIWSYAYRWRRAPKDKRFRDALRVLDHCADLRAGGLQVGVGGWRGGFAGKVRDHREKLGLFLEGQVGLPKDEGDLPRFEADLAAGREAGATVFRAVCLGGRRYETFSSAEDWDAFLKRSRRSLRLAEKVAAKRKVKLAIENHKDWRAPELLDLLDWLDSEWVGVCIDTGNSIALLENPMEVVEAYAPRAFTTHFKDMAVAPHEKGFLLSEVPLGQGFLDLPKILAVCRRHNPRITFNLEMITRDPLLVPVLTDKYWATLRNLPGSLLASALARVKEEQAPETDLPRTSGLNAEQRLALEERNARASFEHARRRLLL